MATLDYETRMTLIGFACAFAWADLELHPKERELILKLMERLEIRAGKRIDLHYRHPVSGDWRLVKSSELAADGSFSIPWHFSSRGYTFSLRATVTGELGWPFAPTRSRVLAVTVRQ